MKNSWVYIFEDLRKIYSLCSDYIMVYFSWITSNHEIHKNLSPSKFTTHTITIIHDVHDSCMDLRGARYEKYLENRICMYVTCTIACFNHPSIFVLMKCSYGRTTNLEVL